jgi:DNA/RNA-binding domain of Phe-tRNA-synthetase-like protein
MSSNRGGDELDLRAAPGFVDEELSAELPGLRLDWMTLPRGPQSSPPELVRRLRTLSNRYRGASVVAMRTQPIPHAYRTFYRQMGLDPDVDRIPSEQAAVARLLHGGFRSYGALEDALLVALIETGVPVWALDADVIDPGGLGIRATVQGDRLGSGEPSQPLAPGRLVVADAARIHAMLFGEVAPGHGVGPRTKRIAVFSVGVEGVPAIHVEEALWICAEAMRGGG